MNNNICQTCLSKDRRLIPQERIRDLLREIDILEIGDKNSGICWECHHIMLKYFKFKLQVSRAQESINFMGQGTQCFSNLSTISKNYYDYQFTFHSDPLTNETDTKTDIKLEDLTDFSENVCDESKINTAQLLTDKKPDVNEVKIEVFVHLHKAQNKPLNNEDDDDVVDSGDSNFNDPGIDLNVKNPNIDSDINVPVVKSKSKKKERDKKIKDRKSNRKKTEKESELHDELKSKFSKVMYSEEEMQKHREEKRNHPNFKKIPFKCDSCVLGFTRKDNLDIHMEKKHNQSFPYTCHVCLTRYPRKRPLARHVGTHFARYRCALCPYETREMWYALNHCRVKHKADEKGRLHCPHCDTQARTQEDLSEHIKTQHVLYCNECGEKFKGKHTLRAHKSRIHGVKRDFSCDICHKTFKTRSRSESHAASHNAATAKRLAYCATCDVQYKNIYVYRNHLKTSANHSERAYPCPECNKKFVSKVYWTKHYNFYHLQKSKFNCDICTKLFISEWRLRRHKQTQHGLSRSRDHACAVCGKKFYTMATLRGHQLTHSEHRSFMCEDCGDTFKQRPALYTHTRLVHQGVKRKK